MAAVLFDLDGLLVDSEPHSIACWRAVLARRDVSLTPAVLDRMLGLRLREATELVIASCALSDDVESLMNEKLDYQIEHLAARVLLMPGVGRILRELDRRGVPRAVASSGARRYVTAVLDAVGLTREFPVVITGDDVVRGKPAPDIFLAAAAALSMEPAACLVLEDAPTGVRAAKAAGMRCVAVPNAHTRDLDLGAADAIVKSLDDVASTIDQLLPV